MGSHSAYRFGRFQLVPAQRQLLVDGRPTSLGARAIDLLHALVERRDRTVAKSELLDAVWSGLIVEEANLHVQVSALRKVLGPQVIATVPGRGYRFVAALDDEPAEPSPRPAPATISPHRLPGLPVPVQPLIGRDDDLVALAQRVSGHPLVTLTGPGGIGKTRLALDVARTLAERWADDVAWVELASVSEPAQVPQAVAQALRLTLAGARDVAQLVSALRSRSVLLVIDNCEHLLDAVASVAGALRQGAPGVHLLLTSQEALNLPGEAVVRLPPLALPGAKDVPDERYGALRLFAERARAVDRHFALDAATGAVVADICRQLDGLPLAIELAAARVRLLGPSGLRDRLGDRLRLLTHGARDALPRHQALRAALEWSHSLLGQDEQRVLRRLGVFVGGFTLEFAQRVACSPDGDAEALDDWAVLEAVGGLVDKSLVTVDADEPVRYRLLETMRVFALEQLEAAGEAAAWRARHARVVADHFAAVDESRFGDDGRATANEVTLLLEPEIDNARAALDWAMEHGDWPLAITLAGAAAALYTQLGLIRELLPTLRRLLPHVDSAPPVAQINLLWRLGTAGLLDGMGHDQLQAIKEEAVRRARAAGLRRRLQTALAAHGFTLARRGDIDGALEVIAEMKAIERPTDPVYARALRLSVDLMVHEHRQDLEQVVAVLGLQRAMLLGAPEESLPLMTTESNLALYLNCLGRHDEAAALGKALLARPDLPPTFLHVACHTAYALAASGRLDEALEVMRSRRRVLAAMPIGLYSGESLAMMCLAGGRLDDAVRIDAAIERHLRATDNRVHPQTRAFRRRLADAVAHAAVDPADLARWRAEGESLSDEAAVALALAPRD